MEGVQEFLGRCDELAGYTVVRVPALENAVASLGEMSGFEADKLKTLLVLLLAYPLSLVHVNLGSTTAKHLFSATTGIFLAQFVFGSAWIHSFISSIVVYVCMLALPRRRMPVVVFVFTMLYLTLRCAPNPLARKRWPRRGPAAGAALASPSHPPPHPATCTASGWTTWGGRWTTPAPK